MRSRLIIVLLSVLSLNLFAQEDYVLSHVIEDIYATVVEEGIAPDFEEMQSNLLHLNEHKININQATPDDLRQLLFLDEEQIGKLLVYRDQHPLHSIYELQLVPGLKEWEYRFLALFVEAGETTKEKVYVRDLFRCAKHEVDGRIDTRNLENFTGDPVYTSLRYQFRSMRKLEFGLTAERDPGEPLSGPKMYGFDHYGGYFQLSDVGPFHTIVAGDYRANFGLGLVVSSQTRFGKTAYLNNLNFGRQGLRKYGGTNESEFFRGAGTTLRFGPIDATVWYSYKKVDANLQNGVFPSFITTGLHRTKTEISRKKTVGQHIIGANLTYNWQSLRVGITATENLLSDTLRPKPTLYNEHYFVGKRQAIVGAYAFFHYGPMQLFGEVAATQNRKWGVGTLIGSRVTVAPDVNLLMLGRYYSPWFDNLLADAFGESSRNNDELGFFASTEVRSVKNWRFALSADVFYFSGPKYRIPESLVGCEWIADVDWQVIKPLMMALKLRWKRTGGAYQDKCQARYVLNVVSGGWRFETALEGSLCHYADKKSPSLGGVIRQNVEYRFACVPIVLQTRLEWFDVPNWNNRLYAYENDVLYAFNIPALYGQGGRWYVNARYQINEHFGLYLKVAETIYTPDWAKAAARPGLTQTDIHMLLRMVF